MVLSGGVIGGEVFVGGVLMGEGVLFNGDGTLWGAGGCSSTPSLESYNECMIKKFVIF